MSKLELDIRGPSKAKVMSFLGVKITKLQYHFCDSGLMKLLMSNCLFTSKLAYTYCLLDYGLPVLRVFKRIKSI